MLLDTILGIFFSALVVVLHSSKCDARPSSHWTHNYHPTSHHNTSLELEKEVEKRAQNDIVTRDATSYKNAAYFVNVSVSLLIV